MRVPRNPELPAAAPGDGVRYLVVCRTFAKAPVFACGDAVAIARVQFLRAAVDCGVEILTYCFLCDRADLVIEEAGDAGRCGEFVARARLGSARTFRARCGQALWAPGAEVRRLIDTEEAAALSRHILAGPVRARLVARPGDYPFSGSFAWHRRMLLEPRPRAGACYPDSTNGPSPDGSAGGGT